MSEQAIVVWECADGHLCAVSEAVMVQAPMEPTCPIRVDGRPGNLCGARLVRPVSSLPPAGAEGGEMGMRRVVLQSDLDAVGMAFGIFVVAVAVAVVGIGLAAWWLA